MTTAEAAGETPSTPIGDLSLEGGGGEVVDLRRTLASHGVATLPPQRVDEPERTLETTVLLATGRACTVLVRPGPSGRVEVAVAPGQVEPGDHEEILGTVRRLLNLDEDLSGFYGRVAGDDALAWAAAGAGRMMRGPSVFEDVVKTICTTNCAWSATIRMVGALVEHLGATAPDGRKAFPTPTAMAESGEGFYREVVRAGYRGSYLRRVATEVSEGRLDLEALRDPELADAEVEKRLLAMPGVGPYAAAHVMLISLGRYGKLILDSWTRPTYARLIGRPATDKQIERRFRRYGDHAGLAFWLFVTRDWVEG